jgi:hypothetical protein
MSATFCSRCGGRLAPDAAGVLACPQCDAAAAFAGGTPPPPPTLTGPAVPPPPMVTPPPPVPPPPFARPYNATPASSPGEFQQKAAKALDYGKRASLIWADHAREAFAKHVRDIRVSDAEREGLASRGIVNPAVQQHYAWRRALLWFIVLPGAFTALLGTIELLDGDTFKDLNALGVLLILAYAATLWAIPVATVFAARTWDQPQRSRRFLVWGFVVAFLSLILFGLFPFSWAVKYDEAAGDVGMQKQGVGLIAGLTYFALLLPVVLSLLPGVIRACVRIKVLFPESVVSGWILVTVTPIYTLILTTVFILVNQAAGNLLLIAGMAALVAAPIAYLLRAPLFIRPLWNDEHRRQIERAQWIYFTCLAVSLVLLLTYVFSVSVFGKRLVATDDEAHWVDAGTFTWHAIKFVIDYLGRSLFITVIAFDLLLMVNLSVHANTKEFERTDHAPEYERTLEELGRSLGAGDLLGAFPVVAVHAPPSPPSSVQTSPPPPASPAG